MKKYIKSFNGFINDGYEFKNRRFINNHTSINEELSIADVIDNHYADSIRELYLSNRGLTSLEGSPKKVRFFNVSRNQLKNLIGGPKEAEEYNVSYNQLESLEGSPEEAKYFYVFNNKLKDLVGGPDRFVYYYNASDNQLKSLEGSPEDVVEFDVSNNKLKNLIGGPKRSHKYYVSNNQLESLEGSPEEVNLFDISNNPTLKDTDGIPKKIYRLYLAGTIHSADQFTEYPNSVGEVYFDEIPIEEIKKIVSNIKEVKYVYVGSKKYKYTKDEILNM